MKKATLSQANPKGRIDVLAYRMLERFFQQEDPTIWNQIQKPIEQACRKHLGPRAVNQFLRRLG